MPQSLDVKHAIARRASTFPNGCHVAEVEVDPETGGVEIVRYTIVNDFGVVVNPLLVDGQVHGGIVQGIGQALMEQVVYDDRRASRSPAPIMDYALPRADDSPFFDVREPPACPPPPTRSASRAAARPAVPARCRR